jgi:hypothetical protein
MRCSLWWVPVCAVVAACTAVRDVQPSELSRTHPPTRVWATLPNRSVLMLDSAFVQGDTLIGKVDGGWQRLPLADGETLHAREPSQSRTLALVALTAGATAAASWYLLKQDGAGPTPHPCFADCALLSDGSVANCYCC